jgi:hypothetical protein
VAQPGQCLGVIYNDQTFNVSTEVVPCSRFLVSLLISSYFNLASVNLLVNLRISPSGNVYF